MAGNGDPELKRGLGCRQGSGWSGRRGVNLRLGMGMLQGAPLPVEGAESQAVLDAPWT